MKKQNSLIDKIIGIMGIFAFIGLILMFYYLITLPSKCPNDGSTKRLHDSRCIGNLTYGKK